MSSVLEDSVMINAYPMVKYVDMVKKPGTRPANKEVEA